VDMCVPVFADRGDPSVGHWANTIGD
jgi:hypothetical protein